MYGDRRFRTNPGGHGGNNYPNPNYDNWQIQPNNMRGNGTYNNVYNGPPNQGYYPPGPPPQMMPSNNNQGPMRPLIDSYNQPTSVQTQQVFL